MRFTKKDRDLIEQIYGTAMREKARFDTFLERHRKNEEKRKLKEDKDRANGLITRK